MSVSATRAFPALESSPALARRWVVDVLGVAGLAADDLSLLVSELVTNSLLHAGLDAADDIVVDAGWEGGCVRVSVCDQQGRFDAPSASPGRTEGGRGLKIVERLCEDWGVHRKGITRVWFLYRPAGGLL